MGNEGNTTHKQKLNKQDLKGLGCIYFDTPYFSLFKADSISLLDVKL